MKEISNFKNENISLKGEYRFILRDAITGKIKKIQRYENIVPTVGRALLANNLTTATPTNDPQINYVALGSGATTPANSDTQLTTEVYRNQTASSTNSNNIAYVTGFFSASETSGTYAEAGIFADGTGTANTGVLISHVLISVTKSNTETLTIDWTLTIT